MGLARVCGELKRVEEIVKGREEGEGGVERFGGDRDSGRGIGRGNEGGGGWHGGERNEGKRLRG